MNYKKKNILPNQARSYWEGREGQEGVLASLDLTVAPSSPTRLALAEDYISSYGLVPPNTTQSLASLLTVVFRVK